MTSESLASSALSSWFAATGTCLFHRSVKSSPWRSTTGSETKSSRTMSPLCWRARVSFLDQVWQRKTQGPSTAQNCLRRQFCFARDDKIIRDLLDLLALPFSAFEQDGAGGGH